ncbi:hypothetical protein EVAR_3432_1 [Eumeta japonica]|uniref:Uncharacterized protein n=1 Tax=Eumeta variegata TaxID=151549 RepID=A0A4C1ST68_EUMVA|nr:hypothetical protein EVAR_3432_1 [Eumeta japonica]
MATGAPGAGGVAVTDALGTGGGPGRRHGPLARRQRTTVTGASRTPNTVGVHGARERAAARERRHACPKISKYPRQHSNTNLSTSRTY